MNKSEITYSIVEHLAVLSARPSGYTKELNLVAWNGHDEKLDVRDWAPDHSKSMKGITLTETEGRALLRALSKYFQRLDETSDERRQFQWKSKPAITPEESARRPFP